MKKLITWGLTAVLLSFSFHGTVHAEKNVDGFKQQIRQVERQSVQGKNHFEQRHEMKEFAKKEKSMLQNDEDEILFEDEPNDDFDTANLHDINYFVSGTINYEDDIDLFQVTVKKGGSYLLFGGGTDEYGLLDLGIGLFNEYEELLDPYDGAVEDDLTAFVYKLSPGTYYMAALDLDEYGVYEDYVLGLLPFEQDTTPPAKPKVNPISDKDNKVTGKSFIKIPKQKAGTHISYVRWMKLETKENSQV